MRRSHRGIAIAAGVLAAGVLIATAAWAAANPTRLFFSHGSSSAYASGEIVADARRVYVLAANAGQTMTVSLATQDPALSFTVTPPNGADALYVGRAGTMPQWSGTLSAEGEYMVTVHFAPAGPHPERKARFKLTVTMS